MSSPARPRSMAKGSIGRAAPPVTITSTRATKPRNLKSISPVLVVTRVDHKVRTGRDTPRQRRSWDDGTALLRTDGEDPDGSSLWVPLSWPAAAEGGAR